MTKTLICLSLLCAFGATATAAPAPADTTAATVIAKRGADDPAGDDRGGRGRGADDPAGDDRGGRGRSGRG